MFATFITAFLIAIFLQNSIFEKALGINILLYASRDRSNVIGFTLGLCYITILSSISVWALETVLNKYEHYHLFAPVLYVGVVGIIYIISLIIIWRFFHGLFKKIRKFAHLAVFNCAVIGALFINTQSGGGLLEYLGYGLGTGLGFLFAGFLLYAAYSRLNNELVPDSFRGMPIMIIYTGIISMALYAFTGYAG